MLDKADERFIEKFQEVTKDVIRIYQLLDRKEKSVFGVTMTQNHTLLNLKRHEKLTMNQLADQMGLATSTMTRIVDNLVRDNYIQRVRDDSDRRLVYVTLTEEGGKLAEKLGECTWECFESIVQNIPQGERAAVVNGIHVFLEALECVYAEASSGTRSTRKAERQSVV